MKNAIFPIDELHRISDEWELFFQGKLDKPMIYFASVFENFDNPKAKLWQWGIPSCRVRLMAFSTPA